MKPFRIEPEALAELDDAAARYEDVSETTKVRFVMAIEKAIYAARERPASFPFVHSLTRRVRADPFPYLVLFQDRPEATVVLGILHAASDPDRFLRRSR